MRLIRLSVSRNRRKRMKKPLCSKVPLLWYRFGLAGGGVGCNDGFCFLHRWHFQYLHPLRSHRWIASDRLEETRPWWYGFMCSTRAMATVCECSEPALDLLIT